MNQRLANRITSWSLGPEYDEESDRFQIVSYGILLIIETVYKILILIILGAIFERMIETMAFLIGFCGLRRNAGGIHMKTSMGCMMSVIGLWLVCIFASCWHINLPVYVCLFLLTLLLVAWYAPCATVNNPIRSRSLRNKKRLYSIIYVMGISIGGYIMGCIGYISIRKVLVCAMTVEALTIVHKKREEET